MDFNEYQKETRKTDLGTGPEHNISPTWLYYVLGLAGETGELIEKIKKHFRDDYGNMTKQREEQIVKEAGDVLWYLARLLDELGMDFDDIAETNLKKLFKRMEDKKIHGDGDDR
jgi:NTP pyrophosphatase (non-canonical NTP hydrolase)